MEQILLDRILTINLVMSTVIFYWAAKIYLMPKLKEVSAKAIFVPILILHSLRHLGLMFMASGAVYEGMPTKFAYPAGIGDFIAALLALFALYAIRRDKPFKITAMWVFNVIGTVDLAFAISMSTLHNASPYMGASYWIPSFWVPALLVTHYIVFKKLLLSRTV
ncbi:MAG: hypothetical protein O6849_07835 [Candidatus Dadabacteria bacterium]|nr:hypothetical protein [Candidatus Dadabacteria bacterium]